MKAQKAPCTFHSIALTGVISIPLFEESPLIPACLGPSPGSLVLWNQPLPPPHLDNHHAASPVGSQPLLKVCVSKFSILPDDNLRALFISSHSNCGRTAPRLERPNASSLYIKVYCAPPRAKEIPCKVFLGRQQKDS